MQKIITIVRLLVILSYFLPFVFFFATCNGLNVAFAYNQKQADINEAEAARNIHSVTIDSVESTGINNGSVTPGSLKYRGDTSNKTIPAVQNEHLILDAKSDTSKTTGERLFFYLLSPTDKSLSAIGVAYIAVVEGNYFWVVSIVTSIILSLAALGISFFKNHNRWLLFYIQAINFTTLLVFIVHALISHVTLIFGVFVSFALTGAMFFWQLQQIKPPRES